MGLYQLPEQLNKTILSQIHLKQLQIPKRKRNLCLKWELRGAPTESKLPGVSSASTPADQLLRSSDTCADTGDMPDAALCAPSSLSSPHLPTPTGPCVATAMGLDLISRL